MNWVAFWAVNWAIAAAYSVFTRWQLSKSMALTDEALATAREALEMARINARR